MEGLKEDLIRHKYFFILIINPLTPMMKRISFEKERVSITKLQ